MAAMDFDNLDHIPPIFFTALLKTCWGLKISVFLNLLKLFDLICADATFIFELLIRLIGLINHKSSMHYY